MCITFKAGDDSCFESKSYVMKDNTDIGKKTIIHLLNGIYTRQEAKDALELLRDKQNDPLIDTCMSDLWQEIQNTSEFDEVEYKRDLENADRLLGRISEKKVMRRLAAKVISVAASIAILVVLGGGLFHYFNRANKANNDILYAHISTTYGQTRDFILPDGTQVTLNACSRISYPAIFTGHERPVELEGEAYFQVARDEKHPFIIRTKDFDVQVLGTVFSVKAYEEDEVQFVDVESGRVQVDMPEGMSRLNANEQIEINSEKGSYAKQPSEYQDIAVWRKGYLRFNKTPVEDVARQLERVYNYTIMFREGQEFENLISGEHDNVNLEEVLESIRLTSGISWQIDNEKRTVFMFR